MRPKPTVGLALLTALALAACGSSQTASTTSSSAPPAGTHAQTTSSSSSRAEPVASPCTDLRLAYTSTNGATGHLEVTFSARNDSSHSCRLRGYPAARLLDSSGRALPMKVQRGHGFFPDTMPAPLLVMLRPGARARFAFSIVTNNEYAGARVCRTATTAMAELPSSSSARWTRVSLAGAPKISPCGDQLVVSPIYG